MARHLGWHSSSVGVVGRSFVRGARCAGKERRRAPSWSKRIANGHLQSSCAGLECSNGEFGPDADLAEAE